MFMQEYEENFTWEQNIFFEKLCVMITYNKDSVKCTNTLSDGTLWTAASQLQDSILNLRVHFLPEGSRVFYSPERFFLLRHKEGHL